MSLINYVTKVVHLKIVYFGPGLSGKTTNIQYIFENTQFENTQESGRKLSQLSTENERTLFYDFLPLDVGENRGYSTRLHLFSVPGQTFYEISRDAIFKALDGIVFVADSRTAQMDANIESYDALVRTLDQQGYDLGRLPLVFQYNKRDLSDIVSIQELEATLNPRHRPYFEAVANRGVGVMETLQSISEAVIRELKG